MSAVPVAKAKKTTRKMEAPAINSLFVVFNLPLRNGEIALFRESFLHCLGSEQERQVVSNEEVKGEEPAKNISGYPQVQFRCHRHRAALFACGQGVAVLEKFLERYCSPIAAKNRLFPWMGDRVNLHTEIREKENGLKVQLFNPKLRLQPVVYRLHSWLPLNKENYEKWWKPNRNLPDTDKTKKLEEILISHLCAFIFKNGGYIPRSKIRLRILDKDRLKKIFFKEEGQVAYDIRYTVNLHLPQYLGLGNHPAYGFGWQRLETE